MYIEIWRDPGNRITGLEVRGHAASYASEGNDVVCAAVSALTQALVVGLRQVLELKIRFVKRQAFMKVLLPGKMAPEKAEKAQFLLETVVRSLFMMQDKYSDYVRVEEVFPEGSKNKNNTHAP
jgi:uncharacterized protein